jgi:hypothetical protein
LLLTGSHNTLWAHSLLQSGKALIMSKAEEYRKHAEECEKKAELARDFDAKQTFREAARQWRKMAEQADRYFG